MTADMAGNELYRNAPLVETSLGVGFAPIAGWNVQHVGLYYDRLRARYPRFDLANPIVLGRPPASIPMVLPFPKMRTFYSNADRSRLVQTQDDLFCLNWQKMATEATYPRYSQLRAAFEQEWQGFRDFLAQAGLATPALTRYQISYINVVERARSGAQTLHLGDIFTGLRSDESPMSDQLGDMTLSAVYQIEDIDLTYALQSALRLADRVPVYQFTLTTGMSPSSDESLDLRLMDRLHDTLLSAFEQFTSSRAKDIWGKA